MRALTAGPSLLLLLCANPAWANQAESPWSLGVTTSIGALGIGGLAAILGLWMHRDDDRPVHFAVAMTSLIVAAICVGMAQSYLDEVDAIQKRADLARMMSMAGEIAVATSDHELAALLSHAGGTSLDLAPPPPAPADGAQP